METIYNFFGYFYPSSTKPVEIAKPKELFIEIQKFDSRNLKKVERQPCRNFQNDELKRLLGEKFKNVNC